MGVRRLRWRGDVDRLGKPASQTPPYILAVSAGPAGDDPGPIGFDAVQQAMRAAPRIAEVVADRVYSVDGPGFVRPLHAQGVNVVMGLPSNAIGSVQMVKIRGQRGYHYLLLQSGTYFPRWMPKKLWVPPRHLDGPQLAEWFGRRAAYRYIPFAKVRGSDGQVKAIRFKCPQCAGRLAGNRSAPGTVGVPAAGPGAGRPCCQGTVQIPIDHLDSHQTVPYGTAAFNAAYKARNHAEAAHWHVQRSVGWRHRGYGRAADRARCTMAVTAVAVGHNIRLAERDGTRLAGQVRALPSTNRMSGTGSRSGPAPRPGEPDIGDSAA